MIERAILIATSAHNGQTDRAGSPYILHPLRVMMNVDSIEEKIVAILHDVIEDTNITLQDIKDTGFSPEIASALESLTKERWEPYDEYIDRVMKNRIASEVKLADLKDNMNLDRLDMIDDNDRKRLEKYKRADEKIRKHLSNL